jgi:Xaa-Pro aminopeptidase
MTGRSGRGLPAADCEIRFERLDRLLAGRGLESVWLARPDGFVWLTGGSNVVDSYADVGVAAAGYDGDELVVVTDNVEAERLASEELAACRVERYDWHAGSLGEAVADVAPTPAGADFAVEADGFERVDVSRGRRPLTPADVDRYREAGRATAAAVEAACRACNPDDTEQAVAADLRARLAVRGLEAPVVLVGGGERAPRYRHLTPTDARLGSYAVVSVTTRDRGLYSSCTRTVAFDPPAWLHDRHRAAARVETTALASTARHGPDGTAASVFEGVREAYASLGHADEWREHHQGGAAGYDGREWFLAPGSDATLDLPMAYAYNPTVEGAKSEDTVLVTGDGFETLTDTGEWPTEPFEAVGSGTTLARPAILRR